jgi:hypothetical protein
MVFAIVIIIATTMRYERTFWISNARKRTLSLEQVEWDSEVYSLDIFKARTKTSSFSFPFWVSDQQSPQL